MVVYVPVLRGRAAEFQALDHLPEALAPHILPIVEVVPSGTGPVRDTYDFFLKIRDVAPRGMRVAVDVRHLADPVTGFRRPILDIGEDLAGWGVPVLPVLHLTDSPRQLADAATVAGEHDGEAVIRLGVGTTGLGVDAADLDGRQAEAALERLRRSTGLPAERYALVVDLCEVRSERAVDRLEPVVRKFVSWAQRYPWQSITVVAGAMPDSLAGLPTNAVAQLPRWDRVLWERVRDLGVRYGDYGISHPGMSTAGWPPAPNLRYTADDTWWIYRAAKGPEASSVLYDLYRQLVTAEHWPRQGAAYSWGDREIARRAAGGGGPGNQSNRLAWGISHHFAHVLDDLNEDLD